MTGYFYNGTNSNGDDIVQIMRFNADGTIDNSFDYTQTTRAVSGDTFYTFTGNAVAISPTAYTFVSQSPVGEDRSNLVRVLRTGVYDPSLQLTLRDGQLLRSVFLVNPDDPSSDIIVTGSSSLYDKPLVRRLNSNGTAKSNLKVTPLYKEQNHFYDGIVDQNGDFVIAGNFRYKKGKKPYNTLIRIKSE